MERNVNSFPRSNPWTIPVSKGDVSSFWLVSFSQSLGRFTVSGFSQFCYAKLIQKRGKRAGWGKRI
jgi:hypothetical protein